MPYATDRWPPSSGGRRQEGAARRGDHGQRPGPEAGRVAAASAVSTPYLYLGSLHSDRRPRRAYGPHYDDAYRRRAVPRFAPRLHRRVPHEVGGTVDPHAAR